MWQRSETDRRRVIIVDFQHLAYAFAYGGATSLSTTINVGGTPVEVNTTIPSSSIKAIHRWANGGYNPTAICFDSRNCAKSRKAYIQKLAVEGRPISDEGYKASRETQDSKFYDGVNLTANLLSEGGVNCFKAEGYEADDLIFACVIKAKQQYPDLPIDVITGDADLLPLVDDQVSVFLRSRKTTWAEEKSLERRSYVQIRPYNYQVICEDLSAYKTIKVPYNTVLLAKLLRGDKSDKILGKPDWKPKMYACLLDTLVADGYDLGELFRYGQNTVTYFETGSDREVTKEEAFSRPRGEVYREFGEPLELTRMCEVLGQYVEPEDITHIRDVYNAINLNAAFIDVPDIFKRPPANLTKDITGYNFAELAKAVSQIKVNLPLVN